MTDRNWDPAEEQKFDAMLESGLPELPPKEIVEEVTPWRGAFNRVLVGIVFGTVTLNFLWLDYILPAIGAVLSLLGYRALRRENRWFGGCFWLTVLRSAYFFPALILNTTILAGLPMIQTLQNRMAIIGFALRLAEFVCLWRGMGRVQQKVGLTAEDNGVKSLIFWYLLVGVLAAVGYSGWIIFIGILVSYYFILRSIYRLSKALDEAGYTIQAVPVKVSDSRLIKIIGAALLAGGALGYLLGGSYPMDWQEAQPDQSSDTAELKAQLAELGFPEYVLDDLSAEDLAACEGALKVVYDVQDKEVDRAGTKDLRVTGVAVQLAEPEGQWVVFHHFLWIRDINFYGTEAIQLWPVYRDIEESWTADGETTGRLLYDRGGKTFAAPYYFLGNQTYTQDSIFWGQQRKTDVFAAFSLPRAGEHCRGYVSYQTRNIQSGYLFSSWINYTHQRTWLQYPVITAMESRIKNFWNTAGAFYTVQDALQFYPFKEDGGRIHEIG